MKMKAQQSKIYGMQEKQFSFSNLIILIEG